MHVEVHFFIFLWMFWLSNFTFTFHFHALEKEMATHSSVLAWRIPGMAEPGGLPSMGSHRVGHDWSDLAAAAGCFQFFTIIKGGVLKILDHIFVPRKCCLCIRGMCLHNTLVLIAMLLSRKIVPIYAPRRAWETLCSCTGWF